MRRKGFSQVRRSVRRSLGDTQEDVEDIGAWSHVESERTSPIEEMQVRLTMLWETFVKFEEVDSGISRFGMECLTRE